MHVTLKHHRRMMIILGSGILVLIALLVLAIFKPEVFAPMQYWTLVDTNEQRPPEEYPEAPKTEYLSDEEVVVLGSDQAKDKAEEVLPVTKVLFEYVEVTDGCGAHYEGECLNVRSGPGTDYPVVRQLRNNIILKVGGKVERDGMTWFKIVFDEWLRYPERVEGDWYVSADYVKVLTDEGDQSLKSGETVATTSKHIIVDRSKQKLYAYDGDIQVMEMTISTGLALTPTPRGTFTIFKKTPSRYMQGPLPNIPSDDYYDLPGVPWNLYFTSGGAVIHGAYWHNSFGTPYSHGCVNLRPDDAERLYKWAPLGTTVTVRD